jgi:hypothetical protein
VAVVETQLGCRGRVLEVSGRAVGSQSTLAHPGVHRAEESIPDLQAFFPFCIVRQSLLYGLG